MPPFHIPLLNLIFFKFIYISGNSLILSAIAYKLCNYLIQE